MTTKISMNLNKLVMLFCMNSKCLKKVDITPLNQQTISDWFILEEDQGHSKVFGIVNITNLLDESAVFVLNYISQ